jgi:signal transduction histidine kinase
MLSTTVDLQPSLGKKQKLLMIDDDLSVVASLGLLLKNDYEVYTASTVTEGIRVFTAIRPSLVVLDLKLPDGSGIDALREIRKIDPSATVLILTGYSTRIAAEEALRLGALDYVNKPFDSDDLKRRISKLALLEQQRNKDMRPMAAPEPATQGFSEIRELQNASAAFLHDVAGPLSCLMAGSDLLNHKIKDKDDIASDEIVPVITMMAESVKYLRALVEQWRSFSDLHILLKGKCEVQEAIDLALSQVTDKMATSHVILQIQSQRGIYHVPGNHFALARVLINLVTNAYEAVSPVYGRICLDTTLTESGVQIVVSDNGPGISPSQISKIFTPQFTTKPNGQGLGLFISSKIIEAVEGKISVRSPGRMLGTDFIITLPLV